MIPRELDLLCGCLLSAQMMLVEGNGTVLSPADKAELNEVLRPSFPPSTGFLQHYRLKSALAGEAVNTTFIMRPRVMVPYEYGPTSVDDMSCEEDCDMAMWFPKCNEWRFMFNTGIDPFLCRAKLIKRLYTEPVQESC